MNIKVYNLEGKEAGSLELKDDVFNVKIKPEVVHEVFTAQSANRRESWADTKTKGEVRGGGKKPWAQKGTGRARHGSIRSPIWKGGGVTFGPLSVRNYKSKINKKTRRLATKMCLTDKAQSAALWVVENFSFAEPKTKLFVNFIKSLPAKQKSFLLLAGKDEKNVVRMSNNLQKVSVMPAQDVNVVELMKNQAVIVSQAGIGEIQKVLSKKD
ncbi:MAG: 50S ribosomal protein L4 [Patescibacteria group bacterium]|nr:50S ribosomal protein L4 [Patescibacteria group bacterium]